MTSETARHSFQPSDILPVSTDLLPFGVEDDAFTAFWERWSAWKAAAASNSIRAMTNGMKRFADWARERGHRLLPADPAAVSLFLEDEARDGRSPATCAQRVAALALLHRLASQPDPTKDELVRWRLTNIRKSYGRPQAQALGLRIKGDVNDIKNDDATGVSIEGLILEATKLGETLGEEPASIADRRTALTLRRDAAMLSIAYDAGLRAEEVVRINEDDIATSTDGDGLLSIRRSKTDQIGEGAEAHLSHDAIAHLEAWFAAADKAGGLDGPIFVGVTAAAQLSTKALKPAAVTESFRRLAALYLKAQRPAGTLTAEDKVVLSTISSHSARVGACQDAIAYGDDLIGIMNSYRWTSPAMPARYGRKLLAGRSSAARFHREVRKTSGQ